ncbi:hypothetical protein T440DRAFT_469983 [Plenodomus tracheiphilus IPT5]|uniref:Secreted protein n=1 Tax=Plenodomus tracheiphilus IPT5 TaxID=1408161 RepID=A0A6A7B1U2_9PLEO|nr:hypothetical protein T440DRAFT_469983 [Plenodomus tracheiphilus IPT5]
MGHMLCRHLLPQVWLLGALVVGSSCSRMPLVGLASSVGLPRFLYSHSLDSSLRGTEAVLAPPRARSPLRG